MHKKGIYHRDLKPENIGIDEDMHLKLIDFGTANSIYNYFDKKTKKFVFIDKKTFEEAKLKNEKISDNVIKVDKYNIVLLNEQKVGTAEYLLMIKKTIMKFLKKRLKKTKQLKTRKILMILIRKKN